MGITKKRQEQIYRFFRKKSIRINNFFGRELILVSERTFKKKQKLFERVSGINGEKNYRTRRLFKHIHAFKSGKYVEAHYDYGNPNLFFVLFIIHMIADVIPYFAWHILKGKKPYDIRP
jgi:hypothetical protein